MVGKPSDERECSKKLRLQPNLEMLWSETGFWTIGEQLYIVDYPIISYRKIKFYRVETMDMVRSHWNNGVSGTILLKQWCQQKMQ